MSRRGRNFDPRTLLLLSWIVAFGASPACGDDDDGGSSAVSLAGAGGDGGYAAGTPTSSVEVSSAAGAGGSDLPDSFVVSGVVTDGLAVVAGAIVMQAGGSPSLITGDDGAFTIVLTKEIPGTPTVVAAKTGYRTGGVEFHSLPDEPVELELGYVTPFDNAAGYSFGAPGVGDAEIDSSTKFCGHCHTAFTAQFQTSAHARSAKDPVVQDMYAGVTRAHATQASCEQAGGVWRTGLSPGSTSAPALKCYLGGGVLPDLNGCGGPGLSACDDPALPPAEKPTAFGRCADCHAAGIDGPPGGRSLHEAVGLAYENGNHCDVCHKVGDVDLTKPPGTGGALVMQRPSDWVSSEPGAELLQVMFGPLPDVPNAFMGGSYQPKFSAAEFCGACHEQTQEALLPGAVLDPARWPGGLPTHSTFREWSDGPFNTPGTPCQFCHMPPSEELKSSLDVTDERNASIAFGFVRPPEKLRSHIFRGPLMGSPRLIDGAVTLFLTASTGGAGLTVNVTIQNTTCGHAIPTGEPMRALLLLVRAEGCGVSFRPSGGMTLNDVAGATLEGIVGQSVASADAVLTWPEGALRAKVGDVVRAVRPSGIYDDYAGIGLFADPGLSAAEKGLEIRTPLGERAILAVEGADITLDGPLAVGAADRIYLGDPLPATVTDGAESLALAGGAGYTFARTLIDPLGARNVPHYRAVDIASDNRIAPQAEAMTTHTFVIPAGCSIGTLTATALYRPLPVSLARPRGWNAKDYVIANTTKTVSLF